MIEFGEFSVCPLDLGIACPSRQAQDLIKVDFWRTKRGHPKFALCPERCATQLPIVVISIWNTCDPSMGVLKRSKTIGLSTKKQRSNSYTPTEWHDIKNARRNTNERFQRRDASDEASDLFVAVEVCWRSLVTQKAVRISSQDFVTELRGVASSLAVLRHTYI